MNAPTHPPLERRATQQVRDTRSSCGAHRCARSRGRIRLASVVFIALLCAVVGTASAETTSRASDGSTLGTAQAMAISSMLERAQGEKNHRAVVAEYEPVSIDSLPVYSPGGIYGPAPPPALVVVTSGKLRSGESLGIALRHHGISASVVHVIDREMRGVFDFRHSRPGDRYRLAQDPDGNIIDFRYATRPESSYHLTWNGEGYVVSDEPAELQAETATLTGIISSSLYNAIRDLGESTALANAFADIFAWDIDFSRNVHPGDRFSILYERLYTVGEEGEREYVRAGRIMAASYDGRDGEHSVVLFEEDGRGRYFRPDGTALERAFLAAPLEFRRISSRFQRARQHPILNVTRPHHGIDYAASTGTPIWSVANGTVIFKGWAGASGNLVKVRHLNGYVSYYAHLSKFADELEVGHKIRQKEVLGFVGSTGLSTGPHVCFRVQKHGVYVDPMQISSPAGAPLAERVWPAFRAHRDLLLSDLGGATLVASDEAL